MIISHIKIIAFQKDCSFYNEEKNTYRCLEMPDLVFVLEMITNFTLDFMLNNSNIRKPPNIKLGQGTKRIIYTTTRNMTYDGSLYVSQQFCPDCS